MAQRHAGAPAVVHSRPRSVLLMRLFLANVGVNTGDYRRYHLRSPRFPDGRFEFIPIKEHAKCSRCPGIPVYKALPSWYKPLETLERFIPDRVLTYGVHVDPEFITCTYGDIDTPRAANLRAIAPGDELWFVARLWDHDGRKWTGHSDFYLIGFLTIDTNLTFAAGTAPASLTSTLIRRIANNAHYRRCAGGERTPFRVLIGDRRTSRRFHYALAVTPAVAGHLYGGTFDPTTGTYHGPAVQTLLNKNGQPRRFDLFGSITRTVQPFLDSTVPAHRAHLAALHRLAETCKA